MNFNFGDSVGTTGNLAVDSLRQAEAMFVAEYLVSETGDVPFGGRDDELSHLDGWLDDRDAAPRMLLTAPAGRGKSALLVRWASTLEKRGVCDGDPWHLVFVPISVRAGTSRPEVFLRGLAYRLAAISNHRFFESGTTFTEDYVFVVREQLDKIAAMGKYVLIVFDGLDETLQGRFNASILPDILPPSMKVVLSARWQLGDTSSEGWLKRLGWDRGIRVKSLELRSLKAKHIADVLVKLGAPTDLIANDAQLVGRLAELTEGEPILVRYYAQDLWQLGQQGLARITRADLDDMKPGFGAYFERWLDLQNQLWSQEGQSIDRELVDQVLVILAFALGPLESRDFLDLFEAIHGKAIMSEQWVLEPLRRFVLGNGRAGAGYVLSHPKIGGYLRERRYRGRGKAISNGFANWCLNVVRALNQYKTNSEDASSYALQFTRGHFAEVGLPSACWMELVEDGWRKAWQVFEGGDRGFSADVQSAWDSLRREMVSTFPAGSEFRCALTLSSIRSVGLKISDTLLCAAVEHHIMPLKQAIYLAAIDRGPGQKALLLIKLAEIETIAPEQAEALIWNALEEGRSVHNPIERSAILTALIAKLPREERPAVVEEALTAATAIKDQAQKTKALSALRHFLPADRMDSAIADAKSQNATLAGRVELAPYLSQSETDELFESLKSETESARNRHLAALLPRLSAGQSLFVFWSILTGEDFDGRSDALLKSAGQLAEDGILELLQRMAICGSERRQADALLALAEHISAQELSSAFKIAEAIRSERIRTKVLAALARPSADGEYPTLVCATGAVTNAVNKMHIVTAFVARSGSCAEDVLLHALAISNTIDDDVEWTAACLPLAKHLSADQFETLLNAADKTWAKGCRLEVLWAFAAYLDKDRLRSVFERIKSAPNIKNRFDMLVELLPRLSKSDALEVFESAKVVKDNDRRTELMLLVARYLDIEPRIEAFQRAIGNTMAIDDRFQKAACLVALIPLLAPALVREAIEQAFESAASPDEENFLIESLMECLQGLAADQRTEVVEAIFEIVARLTSGRLRLKVIIAVSPLASQSTAAALFDRMVRNNRAEIGREIDQSARTRGVGISESSPPTVHPIPADFDDEHCRAAVMKAFAARLAPEALLAAVAETRSITSEYARAAVLSSMATNWPLPHASNLLDELERLANEHLTADVLVALASRTDLGPQEVALLAAAARKMKSAWRVSQVMSELLPQLTAEDLAVELKVAMTIPSDRRRAEIAAAIVSRVEPEKLPDTLSLITQGGIGIELAMIPAVLASALSPDDRAETVRAVFDRAIRTTESHGRRELIAAIAPYVSTEQATVLFDLAMTSETEFERQIISDNMATILPLIVHQLTGAQIEASILSMDDIDFAWERPGLLERLMANLSPEQVMAALEVAGRIRDEDFAADVLIEAVRRLPEKQVQPTVDKLRLIEARGLRAVGLAAMSRHLTVSDMRTVLDDIRFIRGSNLYFMQDKVSAALEQIVQYLPRDLISDAFDLAISEAAGSERLDTLPGIVRHLPPSLKLRAFRTVLEIEFGTAGDLGVAYRRKALRKSLSTLIEDVPKKHYPAMLQICADLSAARQRPIAFQVLSNLTALFRQGTSQGEIEALYRSINKVANWYP